MTRTQLQEMDDIALIETAARWSCDPYDKAIIEELVDRFRPYAQAPDAYPFPTHEEEPAL